MVDLVPFSSTPQQAPFQPRQMRGINPLQQGLAAAGQGLLQLQQSQRPVGIGSALLAATSAGIPAFAQAQQFNQQRQDQFAQQQAAAQQQALENARAQQEAQRKAAADAERVRQFGITSGQKQRAAREGVRQFGITEGRLGRAAGVDEELRRGNLAARQAELAQRTEPLVEVSDFSSPSGTRLMKRSEAAGQPGAGSFAGTGLTPKRAEELGAQAGGLRLAQEKLTNLRNDLAENPQRAGALGSANKALQTAGGIARDVLDAVPGISNIADSLLGPAASLESAEVQDFLGDPSIEANQAAANSLAYALAVSRKQGQRVTVQDIATAKDDLKVTGLKSSKQIVARMDELLREIDQGIGLLEDRVATGAPGAPAVTQAIPPQPSGGQVLRFDAQGNPVQ
ncbi:MAG: hypothetical protein ACR2RF_16710 [Geminicoccaceae bacterium]